MGNTEKNRIFYDAVSPMIFVMISIVITMAIISFGFMVYNVEKQNGNEYAKQINDVNYAMENSDLSKYKGVKISGAEVINVIRQIDGSDCVVTVNNGTYTTSYCSGNALTAIAGPWSSAAHIGATQNLTQVSYQNMKKSTSGTYIDPASTYKGEVIYISGNDTTIVGVYFEKL